MTTFTSLPAFKQRLSSEHGLAACRSPLGPKHLARRSRTSPSDGSFVACCRHSRGAPLQGLLTAVPLEEAIHRLRSKWAGFFSSDDGGRASRNPRLARITERRSSLGPIPAAQV